MKKSRTSSWSEILIGGGPAATRRSTVSGSRSRINKGGKAKSNTRTRKGGPPRPRKPGLAGALFNRRTLKKALVLLGVLAAGAGLGAGTKALWSWATHSPRFAIQELVVRTGPRVPERDVLMLADLKPGDNILAFSLSDCVAGIEIHPWVKRASVMRQLPDRVVIEVKERTPKALIALPALYYVDEDAEVFKRVLPGEDLDLPLVTGLNLRDVVEDPPAVEPLLKEALALISLARSSKVLSVKEISEIQLDRTAGAVLVKSPEAVRMRFGHDGYEQKWTRMERTLQELGPELGRAAELDLNFEGRVTVRFREGQGVAAAPAGL